MPRFQRNSLEYSSARGRWGAVIFVKVFSSIVVQAIRPTEYSRPVVERRGCCLFAFDADSPQRLSGRNSSAAKQRAGARKRCESQSLVCSQWLCRLHPIALKLCSGRCSQSNARNSDEQSFPGAAPRSVPLRAIWSLMYPVSLFGSPANQIAHPPDEPRGVITERKDDSLGISCELLVASC